MWNGVCNDKSCPVLTAGEFEEKITTRLVVVGGPWGSALSVLDIIITSAR